MMLQKALTFSSLTALVLLAATPADAQGRYGRDRENALRIEAGRFQVDADSSYWNGSFEDFTGEADDFDGVSIGLDYSRDLTQFLQLQVGASVYEGEADQAYRDFVDNRDRPIEHLTTLSIASATVGLTARLAPKQSPVVPYLGVGGGLYAWNLEESGDFVDFGGVRPVIFSDTFEEDGEAFGWYWLAGIEVPVSSSLAFYAQGRWQDVDDDLEGDFGDLGKLDLSGRHLTAGLSWRF